MSTTKLLKNGFALAAIIIAISLVVANTRFGQNLEDVQDKLSLIVDQFGILSLSEQKEVSVPILPTTNPLGITLDMSPSERKIVSESIYTLTVSVLADMDACVGDPSLQPVLRNHWKMIYLGKEGLDDDIPDTCGDEADFYQKIDRVLEPIRYLFEKYGEPLIDYILPFIVL